MSTITIPLRHGFVGHPRCQRRNNNGEKRCRQQNNPLEHMMKDLWNLPHLAASNVPLVNNPEQLKNFGENLKKFLDPFGIDVSYYVNNMTKEAKKAGESQKTDVTEKEEAKKTAVKEAVVVEADAVIIDDDDIEEVVVSRPLNSMNEGLEKQVQVQEEGEEQVASAPEKPEDEVSVIEPFTAAITALKSVAEANYSADQVASGGSSSIGSMVDGFSLVEIDKELKIIRAIEQLNSMGYSDDGGWLTRLVAAKNGNINAVLDAITPSGPKN